MGLNKFKKELNVIINEFKNNDTINISVFKFKSFAKNELNNSEIDYWIKKLLDLEFFKNEKNIIFKVNKLFIFNEFLKLNINLDNKLEIIIKNLFNIVAIGKHKYKGFFDIIVEIFENLTIKFFRDKNNNNEIFICLINDFIYLINKNINFNDLISYIIYIIIIKSNKKLIERNLSNILDLFRYNLFTENILNKENILNSWIFIENIVDNEYFNKNIVKFLFNLLMNNISNNSYCLVFNFLIIIYKNKNIFLIKKWEKFKILISKYYKIHKDKIIRESAVNCLQIFGRIKEKIPKKSKNIINKDFLKNLNPGVNIYLPENKNIKYRINTIDLKNVKNKENQLISDRPCKMKENINTNTSKLLEKITNLEHQNKKLIEKQSLLENQIAQLSQNKKSYLKIDQFENLSKLLDNNDFQNFHKYFNSLEYNKDSKIPLFLKSEIINILTYFLTQEDNSFHLKNKHLEFVKLVIKSDINVDKSLLIEVLKKFNLEDFNYNKIDNLIKKIK